jgi:hypothetical protein
MTLKKENIYAVAYKRPHLRILRKYQFSRQESKNLPTEQNLSGVAQ